MYSDCAQAAVLPEEMQSEASLHLEGALVRYFAPASAETVKYKEPVFLVAMAAYSMTVRLRQAASINSVKSSLFYCLVATCKLPLLESQVIIIMVANLLSCLAMITMVSECLYSSLLESLFTWLEKWSNVLCSSVSVSSLGVERRQAFSKMVVDTTFPFHCRKWMYIELCVWLLLMRATWKTFRKENGRKEEGRSTLTFALMTVWFMPLVSLKRVLRGLTSSCCVVGLFYDAVIVWEVCGRRWQNGSLDVTDSSVVMVRAPLLTLWALK